MKIKYLGTAAYEGIPSIFCQCQSCKRALKLGGKNLRTRSSAIVNDEILIDFNADTVSHYLTYKFDFASLKYCLITHSHPDHFYPEDLTILAESPYAQNPFPVSFYGGKAAYEKLIATFSTKLSVSSRANITLVSPGDFLTVGDNKILALKADHSPETSPVIYAIEDRSGKRILYAHDTGTFSDDVIADMQRLGRFDIISLDCNHSFDEEGGERNHMSLKTNAMMKELLYAKNLADDGTKIIVNHFSHNSLRGHDHEELSVEAAKYGFIASYDGLEIEV